MPIPSTRDRLFSALLVLALQGFVFALFLYSFEATRSLLPERESFIVFPSVIRPSVSSTVIDARGARRNLPRATAPATSFTPAKSSAAIGQSTSAATLAPSASLDSFATPSGPKPKPETPTMELTPPTAAENQELWDQDMVQKNTPPRVACTYTTADGPSGAAAVMLNLVCSAKKLAGIEEIPPPPKAHASEAAFQAALAAANRRRSIGSIAQSQRNLP